MGTRRDVSYCALVSLADSHASFGPPQLQIRGTNGERRWLATTIGYGASSARTPSTITSKHRSQTRVPMAIRPAPHTRVASSGIAGTHMRDTHACPHARRHTKRPRTRWHQARGASRVAQSPSLCAQPHGQEAPQETAATGTGVRRLACHQHQHEHDHINHRHHLRQARQ